MGFADKLRRSHRGKVLAEAVRRYRYRKALAEARRPATGPYYWVPLPAGGWELMAYPDLDQDHPDVWRLDTAPYLAELWGVPEAADRLARHPYGLPRGRVSIFGGVAHLNHGGDSPVPDWVELVCREYALGGVLRARPEKVKPVYDGHERTQRADREGVQSILSMTAKIPV